jgi:hypothetical protein
MLRLLGPNAPDGLMVQPLTDSGMAGVLNWVFTFLVVAYKLYSYKPGACRLGLGFQHPGPSLGACKALHKAWLGLGFKGPAAWASGL